MARREGGLLQRIGNWLFGTPSKIETMPSQSPEQQQLMKQIMPVMEKFLLDYGTGNAMVDALARADTTFRETVETPMWEQYEKQVLPHIQQSFAGPGTFWGSDRAQAETTSALDIASQLAASRSGYMSQIQEAERAHQANQMNQVLSYLGLPTMAAHGVPGDPGFLRQILSILPNAYATYLTKK
jgi:hypothetical protein